MKPNSKAVRVVVAERSHRDAVPGHPPTYEITAPDEVREVLDVLADAPEPPPDFMCMCNEEPVLTLYDAGRQRIRGFTGHWPQLLDPADPRTVPGRHRAAWAQAAPPLLRDYAETWARGEIPGTATTRSVPLDLVLSWLGAATVRTDAARLLTRLAPFALLEAAPTDELAWAVRETDAAGLDGAVDFFASEGFTTRHPKKRRVGATARDLLLRHARTRRPEHLAVLERRVLKAAEDRIRR